MNCEIYKTNNLAAVKSVGVKSREAKFGRGGIIKGVSISFAISSDVMMVKWKKLAFGKKRSLSRSSREKREAFARRGERDPCDPN